MKLSFQKIVVILSIVALVAIGCWRVAAQRVMPASTSPDAQPAVMTLTTPPEPQESTPRPATPTLAPPTATPLPPTPTPSPTMDIHDWHTAQKYQQQGDYARAIRGYRTLLARQPAAGDARQIRFHLGETYLQNDDPATASVVLAGYVVDYPDDATAWFVLGRSREILRDSVGAIEAFAAYRELDDTLADYAGLRIAAALETLDRTDEAAREYERVVEITLDDDLAATALEGLAEIDLAEDEPATAAERYAQAAGRASEDAEKARLLGLAGSSYLTADQQTQAISTLRQVVQDHPATGAAYVALGELLSLEESVDLRLQGLVYYHNADNAAAVDALTRYLVTQPAPLGDALYFLGRSHERLGRWTSAINAYDRLIENYPGNERYGAAWVRKARAQLRLGDTDKAVATFREFAAQHPEDDLADDALWEAGRALESIGERTEAAEVYQNIVTQHPAGDVGAEASFRIGILPYLDGDYAGAHDAWQLAAEQAAIAEVRARALLWAGKSALALGDVNAAADDLSRTAKIAPLNYDGLRAQALLGHVEPGAVGESPSTRPRLSGWLGLSEATLANVDERFEADHRYQRGRALLAVGLRDEGLAQLRALRNAYWQLPAHLTRLAILLDDPRSRHLSIASAERAMTLTGTSPLEAPAEVAHLAYPAEYGELITAAAERHAFDPRLLLALIRQESRFNPTATSYADARGLTQVIPPTGWYIAGKLATGDFDVEDLYRPHRSIEFGAWYLAEQLDNFGDPILALAAYNGGPGNSRRWQALTDDVDVLVASIHLDQTEEYVRRVTEQYTVYQALYDEQLSVIGQQ